MAGFDHGSAEPAEQEDARTIARNARQGLWLFAVYFSAYAGFVALNDEAKNREPRWMPRQEVTKCHRLVPRRYSNATRVDEEWAIFAVPMAGMAIALAPLRGACAWTTRLRSRRSRG